MWFYFQVIFSRPPYTILILYGQPWRPRCICNFHGKSSKQFTTLIQIHLPTQEHTLHGLRQVYTLFQEPVEQPLLGFMIAEEKPDRLNILKTSSAFGAAKPFTKPLEREKVYYSPNPPPPHTHTQRMSQHCTSHPNMPTSTQLDSQQSQTLSYALQLCSFLWLTADIVLPFKYQYQH